MPGFFKQKKVLYRTFFIDTNGSQEIYVTHLSIVPLMPSVGTQIAIGEGPRYVVQEVELILSRFNTPHRIEVWVREVK